MRGIEGFHHLIHGPGLTPIRIAPDLGGRETVVHLVIGRMGGDKLSLDVGREFGDLDPLLPQHPLQLVAIGFGYRGGFQIEQAFVPTGNLDSGVAAGGRPAGKRGKAVERRFLSHELGQEQSGGP